jgi:hypothetical protein
MLLSEALAINIFHQLASPCFVGADELDLSGQAEGFELAIWFRQVEALLLRFENKSNRAWLFGRRLAALQ